MSRFPDNFLFGVATAAYQIEGGWNEDGRGLSIWDTFSHTPGKVDRNENGDVANDHYHRWESDLDLIQSLGAQAYRFSSSWTRMFPDGTLASRNEAGFDFYNRLIDGMLARNIKPIMTLFHWDLPQALQDKGGWANRETAYRLAEYAGAAAQAFGDRVEMFAPINEPWVLSWLGYGMGYHAPGIADHAQAIAASHHTVLAHNLSWRAIKAERPGALVGPVLSQSNPDVDDIFDPVAMRAAKILDEQNNRFWMDGLFAGKYPDLISEIYGDRLSKLIQPGDLTPVQNDFLGINYYFNSRIGHEVAPDDPGRIRILDSLASINILSSSQGQTTDMGWPITPNGLEDLIMRWTKEFPNVPPIYITENGAAYDDGISDDGQVHDHRRIDYLNDHLAVLKSAIARGADVRGYMQWSLMDNFEWAVGYAKRFGIVHVDYQSQVRTIKDSGHWYREMIKARGENVTTRTITIA